MYLGVALLCRIQLPAGCVGIIEKQFAGEVYGGKVDHLTKPKKKKRAIDSWGSWKSMFNKRYYKESHSVF